MAFIEFCDTDNFTVYQGDKITKSVSLVISLKDDFTSKDVICPLKVTLREGNINSEYDVKSKTGFERNIKPIKNLSGYYVFSGLKESKYILEITPESFLSRFYIPEKIGIDLLKFDINGPAAGDTSTKLKDVLKLQKGHIIEFINQKGEVERKKITDIDNDRNISWVGGLEYNFNAPDDYILSLDNLVVEVSLKPSPSYPFSKYATLVRGLLKDSKGNSVIGAKVKIAKLNLETESVEEGEFVLYLNNVKFKEVENSKISIHIESVKENSQFDNMNFKNKTINITLKEGKTKPLGKIILKEN